MAGMPIWYELATPDVEAAKRFYGDIVGWTTSEYSPPGAPQPYTIWNTSDGNGVGGAMTPPADAQLATGWYAYFHVEDVDAKARDVEAAGGKILMPPMDLPTVGRIVLVADAQGIVSYLMRPDPAMDGFENTSFSETLPQRCSWNELVTKDHKAALPFYGDLLGWVSNEAMPMGPMGDYSFVDVDGVRIGAMMDAQDANQPLKWTFYFAIPDVDAAVEQIKAGGGSVIMGPMEVPGGQRIIVAVDPQGASVGFVSGDGK